MNFEMIWEILGISFALVTVPGTLEILLLTLASLFWKDQPVESFLNGLKLGVIIPAHNEEASLPLCINGLQACDLGENSVEFVVIADNCTDRTIRVADELGVRAIERVDPLNRGKGPALKYAFDMLLKESFDAFLIVDADTLVAPDFISLCAQSFQGGAKAIQCRYLPAKEDGSVRSQIMNLALLAFHVVRPRGRSKLGFSCGIFGNGFGLSREAIEQVPYTAESIVEDLEYHIALVENGVEVVFQDNTTVRSEFPADAKTAQMQRARWEGGRFQVMKIYIPKLLWKVFSGKRGLVEPLFELLTLPLSFHIMVLLVVAVIPYDVTQYYAILGLGIVALHVIVAVLIAGTKKDFWVLFWAPFYILWKFVRIPIIWRSSKKGASWERTTRQDG